MKIDFKMLLFFFFLFCIGIGGYFSLSVINIITSFIPEEIVLVSINPSDGFMVLFWATISIGLLLFSFGCGIFFWYWSKDILYKAERRLLKRLVLPVVVLYVVGFLFGLLTYFFIVLPYFVEVNSLLGIQNFWDINDVLSSGLFIGCAVGLSFQLCIVVRLLLKFGLVEKELLVRSRLLILAGIFLLSGIITPPDVMSSFGWCSFVFIV